MLKPLAKVTSGGAMVVEVTVATVVTEEGEAEVVDTVALEVRFLNMSCVTRKPTMWCLKRSYTNRAVQPQKTIGNLKFCI